MIHEQSHIAKIVDSGRYVGHDQSVIVYFHFFKYILTWLASSCKTKFFQEQADNVKYKKKLIIGVRGVRGKLVSGLCMQRYFQIQF